MVFLMSLNEVLITSLCDDSTKGRTGRLGNEGMFAVTDCNEKILGIIMTSQIGFRLLPLFQTIESIPISKFRSGHAVREVSKISVQSSHEEFIFFPAKWFKSSKDWLKTQLLLPFESLGHLSDTLNLPLLPHIMVYAFSKLGIKLGYTQSLGFFMHRDSLNKLIQMSVFELLECLPKFLKHPIAVIEGALSMGETGPPCIPKVLYYLVSQEMAAAAERPLGRYAHDNLVQVFNGNEVLDTLLTKHTNALKIRVIDGNESNNIHLLPATTSHSIFQRMPCVDRPYLPNLAGLITDLDLKTKYNTSTYIIKEEIALRAFLSQLDHSALAVEFIYNNRRFAATNNPKFIRLLEVIFFEDIPKSLSLSPVFSHATGILSTSINAIPENTFGILRVSEGEILILNAHAAEAARILGQLSGNSDLCNYKGAAYAAAMAIHTGPAAESSLETMGLGMTG